MRTAPGRHRACIRSARSALDAPTGGFAVNDHTIQLVRDSFDLVEPIAPQAAALFYAHLFAADPSVKPLFRGDMIKQGEHLMETLRVAVAKLDDPEVLMPVLQGLGQRHAGYGVRDAHYDSVGVALLETLRQGLGVAFTEDVEEAWVEVYGVIASTMKEAAKVPA
jgi:hemoglobin-like flavoprotein